MRWSNGTLVGLVLGVLVTGGTPAQAAEKLLNFDGQPVGGAPADMTCMLAGKGRPGDWRIAADEAGGTGRILAQVGTDNGETRYPICIVNGVSTSNIDVSVRFRPVAGSTDQAAGLVWRVQDKDNFYVVRGNALENNVVLYKMEKGKRTDLPVVGQGRSYGVKAPVPKLQWSTLRVSAVDDTFTVFLNGQELFKVQDATLKSAGGVGIWTKADSVTQFDDLRVTWQ